MTLKTLKTLERTGPPCGCGSTTYLLYEKAICGSHTDWIYDEDYDDDVMELRDWAYLSCADIDFPIYVGQCAGCRMGPVFYHIDCGAFMACVALHTGDYECPFCEEEDFNGTGKCDYYALEYMVGQGGYNDMSKLVSEYLKLDQYLPWPVAMTVARYLFCSEFLLVYDLDVVNYHGTICGPGITGHSGGGGPDFACLVCKQIIAPCDK